MARVVSTTKYEDGLKTRLKRRGWKVLGSGYYGSAWVKGSLIWKIQGGNSAGWGEYVQAVARGELTGPHVPRVKLVLLLACGGIAALMERLEATLYEHHGVNQYTQVLRGVLERDSDRIYAAASRGVRDRTPATLVKSVKGSQVPQSLLKFSKDLVRWVYPQFNIHDALIAKRYMDLTYIPKGRPRRGVDRFDCHSENVMIRKDGTLVVIDPVT
jgi:hypothetical protein